MSSAGDAALTDVLDRLTALRRERVRTSVRPSSWTRWEAAQNDALVAAIGIVSAAIHVARDSHVTPPGATR